MVVSNLIIHTLLQERVLYEEFIPPEFQYHPSLHKLCRRTELLQSAPIMALPSRYPAIVLGLFILGIFCTYRFTTWKSKSAKKVAKLQNVAILKKHLPKAIIIGSGKSGTRALLVILKIHPDIKACPKEVNFFNRNENYKQGLDWYRSQMPKSREDQLTVEKSPGYFTSMTVPRRVYRWSKDVKLLVIVRDPTARAISDYTQLALKENNSLLPKFEDYVTKEASIVDTKRSVVKNGVYINHLRQWLMYFPFSQIHFVSGEGLVQNPAAEIRPVEKFLHLRPFITEKNFYFNRSKGFPCFKGKIRADGKKWSGCLKGSKGRKHVIVRNETIKLLQHYYRPYNHALYGVVGRDFHWP